MLEVEYNKRCALANKAGTTVTGRQLICMVINHYKTSNHMSTVYTYDNLNDLAWMGDNKILEFLEVWDHIIKNLAIDLGDAALRYNVQEDAVFQEV